MAFDGRIAAHAIRTNMAHMISLVESGEVNRKVGGSCLAFLAQASAVPKRGAVSEDFHQFLEQEAVNSLGVEVAGYMNLGKSRNDQVATAIRMELREQVLVLLEALCDLQESLLAVVKSHGKTVIPGYTHLQHAQPVTLAHHYLAYFDCFQRDVERLFGLYTRVNLSPMGSAALGGTSVRVDRQRLADLLGFDGVVSNAMDAVSSRDFVVESLCCATMAMLDMSRLSEELVLWSSKEFGFVELSDEYANSSSIMPQKKNPVAAEIARAKCGSVLGGLVAVCAIIKALPYSYNLDLQETTLHLWRALDDTIGSANVLGGMVVTMVLNQESIAESMKADYSTATAFANQLVKSNGISFRQAHAIAGELVRISIEKHEPFERTVVEHIARISSQVGRRIRVGEAEAKSVLDPSRYLPSIVTEGGSNPALISGELAKRSATLNKNKSDTSKLDSRLRRSRGVLNEALRATAREVRN
jgi:argininosuccinate lyase